jgi:Fe-S oxidoreductase
MFGPALYQAFREIKRTFDPRNLLNPGKIVDAPPLTANLRYGPTYVTPDVATMFDFSSDGGLTRAAELCAGVGECRKTRAGTMCPSYQATRDELHSTRGRANTLRLALTGQLDVLASHARQRPESGLLDSAVHAAMDLCLECKACKSECPTNVDMARLKAEFLHQHHKKHGLPWRNWMFGHIAALSGWGRRGGRISQWLMETRPSRWLMERCFGIDRRRPLPRLARQTFYRQFCDAGYHRNEHPAHADPAGQVFLFPDTFVVNHEPEIGMAATQLLHRLRQRVHLWREDWPPDEEMWCCGRPMISNGMLDEASRCAAHNVEILHRWAETGRPIIACEPSCILTIKDDYVALLKGELRKKAEAVAAACFTFEEHLDALIAKAEVSPFRPGPTRILVQGHCHQRSLVGMGATLRLLRRIPGAEVIDLDAGCCGMAGSFGYEMEHYEVSRLVGEQRLFPAVRKDDAATTFVAPGFSCRLQVEHFTGKTAVHPATLLRSLLTVNV